MLLLEGVLLEGVVGTGHLGKYHVRIRSNLPNVELTGISDSEPDRLREIFSRSVSRWYIFMTRPSISAVSTWNRPAANEKR